mmetsp:Transcript_54544/g.162070  ORF Transcript_54544/g.162070 Transcript_54544/m.162070 type:complete len:340 (+) Transcript_54544:1168-2187(+)
MLETIDSTSTGEQATATAAYSPSVTLTVLSASEFFSRTSGMAISSAFFLRSGRRSGAKHAMSAGLFTSLNMVSHTTAALRTMFTLPLTRRPRSSTGMMMESVGSSTAATYVVATSLSRHDSPSVSGFMLAEMTVSMRGATSALSITRQHSRSALVASSLIAGLGSCETSMSLVTILGSESETALADVRARAANILTAASLVCQRCSSNSLKSSGSIASTASGDRPSMSAVPASSALICTLRSLSAQRAMTVGNRVMRNDSTQRAPFSLAHLARSITPAIEPTLVALSSAAFLSATHTALQLVLSVWSRMGWASSAYLMSSGSFDILLSFGLLRARATRA